MLQKYLPVIVTLALLITALVLSVALPLVVAGIDTFLNPFLITLGWMTAIIQLLYLTSEGFYIRVNGIRLWVTNESVKWNFVLELQDCQQQQPLESIWHAIRRGKQQVTLWHQDASTLIVNMPGYTIRAFLPGGPDSIDDLLAAQRTVSIQISNLELPFRSLRFRIESEIVPLIKDMVSSVAPRSEKYAAKISFSSANPYFGFFVRKLDLPKVVSFNCDLIESSIGGHDQMVTVRKDRLEIVTDDLFALQSLSLKYMTLSAS